MTKIFHEAVVEIIDSKDKLQEALLGEPMTIKLGFDPSSPNLHIGHYITLRQLKYFMDLGHKVVFVIGDFTGMIGDPTGRNKARLPLNAEQVKENAQTYFDQVGMVLDTGKIEVRYNSEWLNKIDLSEWLKILSSFSVNSLIERDDFQKRLTENATVGLHELMYPPLQAYDSVALEANLEVGGTDQTFNLLAGRELQKKLGQQPQFVLIIELLVGTDGVKKMSKSIGNTIDLIDTPEDKYGKTMSLPDEAVEQYCRLVLEKSLDELKSVAGSDHPMALKKTLAHGIVEIFHPGEGDKAAENFERVVSKGEMPEEVNEVTIDANSTASLKDVLVANNLVASGSQVQRLAEQGSIKADGKALTKDEVLGPLALDSGTVIQYGKRQFVKLIK